MKSKLYDLEPYSFVTREMEALMQRASAYDLVVEPEAGAGAETISVIVDWLYCNELSLWRALGAAAIALLFVSNYLL